MSIADAIPITAFATVPWVDRGLSKEARALRDWTITLVEFPRSVALGEPKHIAQQALYTACLAAQADNRDAMGSARVEPSTYEYASQLLRMLPTKTPVPDIAIDTDGEILFEWDRGPRYVFSVSVGRDGTLTFAGLFGYSKIHGTDHIHEALLLVVAQSLRRVAGHPST